MNDQMLMDKVAEVRLAAFYDGLEKIAADGALSEPELLLLKEAIDLAGARAALQRGVSSVGQALEQRGMAGAGKVINALNVPIETGAAGAALQSAGHHLQHTAAPGIAGGFRHGIGEYLHHQGEALAPGGGRAIASAAWRAVNPVGQAAEAGLMGAGHMASRGLQLNPQGTAHKVLTSVVPKAGELLGPAGLGAAIHAPVGAAGVLGGHVLHGAGAFAPHAAEAVGHAAHGLGGLGGALVHRIGADIAATAPASAGRQMVQGFRGLMSA